MGRTITLSGVSLRCIEELPAGYYFDLCKELKTANVVSIVASFGEFLHKVVLPEDQEELKRILYDEKNVISYPEVDEAIGTLIVSYSRRPLELPSPSPSGPETTGGPSRLASLSPATDKQVTPPSRRGRLAAS